MTDGITIFRDVRKIIATMFLLAVTSGVPLAADADLPPLELGTPFALGPYRGSLPATPVEVHFIGTFPDHDDEATASVPVVVELDENNRVVAWPYPCALTASPERPGTIMASFVPFPLPGGEMVWPAGVVRRFMVRWAKPEVTGKFTRLEVASSPEQLVAANAYYRMALASVEAPLSGHARGLIRKITLAGGREFAPTQTVADLTERVDGKDVSRMWHFDPAVPPQLERHGVGMATVTYGGGYEGVDVTWRTAFTFYADLPLVKIRFERRRRDSRSFSFGRTMQIYFNPQASGWPVEQNQVAQKRDDWVSLAVATEATAQIAFLMSDNRASGLAHWAATWGYLCPSWEADGHRPFRTGNEDVREFHLLLSGEPEAAAALDHRVRSLRELADADWHARTRRLFESLQSEP